MIRQQCVGGGSNFAGIALPFYRADILGGRKTRFVAIEPHACPTLTEGPIKHDFGDTAETTPLLRMHSLGHAFVPPPIHAGGLRYRGMAPIVSRLVEDGVVESVAYDQVDVFTSAVQFARAEGITPAPEIAHAVWGNTTRRGVCGDRRSQDNSDRLLRTRPLRHGRLFCLSRWRSTAKCA